VLKVSRDGVLLGARALRHANSAPQSNASELAVPGNTVFCTGRFRDALSLGSENTADDGGAGETECVAASAFQG